MTAIEATARLSAPRDPVGRSAVDLAAAIATDQLDPVEVVQAHLERIEEVDAALNATVAVDAEQALAEARRLRGARSHTDELPLLGVPFSVKDVIATAQLPTTCGSAAFVDNRPVVDAEAVRRLRAAGAILLAKTNCPEFAFGVTTENEVFGRTGSPFGSASPGGSSGGEAALVAGCGTVVGLGTDYGGSLRWPAQSTGLLALRPTVGTVPGAGQLPGAGGTMDGQGEWTGSVQQAFQVIGPIARSVADLALVTGVIADDPQLVRAAREGRLEQTGIRVAWSDTEEVQRCDKAVLAGLHAALAALADGGATLVETPAILDGLHEAFNGLRRTDGMVDLRLAVGQRVDMVGSGTRALLAAQDCDEPGPWWSRLVALRHRALRSLGDADVLIVPVAPVSACAPDGTAPVDDRVLSGFELMAQCRAVTALACPVVSIPVGSSDGYPTSVQVIGRPGREHALLAVAAAIERLTGGRVPPPWLPHHDVPEQIHQHAHEQNQQQNQQQNGASR